MMGLRKAAVVLACIAFSAAATAKDRTIEEVDSVTAYSTDRITPSTIVFNDESRAEDSPAGLAPGLISFDDWSRARPDEKQLLGLYPDYTEEPIGRATEAGRQRTEKLTMYVARARFILDRAVALADLAQYATLAFVEHVDPSIKHKLIAPADVATLENPKLAHNRNPMRPWCTGGGTVTCMRSHYRLEGKLPLGIQLANKVRDEKKKIADYLEFESELAVRAPEDFDQAALARLTGLDTSIIGALEQSTFYVNQILQFAKSVVIFQRHPSSADKTVVTAFIAIAVESRLLNSKKEYAKVPVLRNLVPVQVLMGKSSFNTGTSISAGLPQYTRSRVRAIADILDKDQDPKSRPRSP